MNQSPGFDLSPGLDPSTQKRLSALIIENAPACIALLRGPDFVFEVVNPAFAAIEPGVPMLGRTVRDAFPDAAPVLTARLQHTLRTGEPFSEENLALPVRRGSGAGCEVGYFSFSYTRIADGSSDETHSILVLALETTARKRAEQEMRSAAAELERQWRTFDTALSNTPDFTYIFDREGRFTYVNKALLELWQKSYVEAIGKNFFELEYPTELAETLHRQIQQVIETRAPIRAETPFTGPTGITRYYEYIFVPIKGPAGEVEAVAGSTRDISERRESEERLRETAKLESLGVLAGGVAHDFNNLLVGIIGNASLAQDSLSADDPNRELLDDIISAGARAALLTKQMLAYSGRGRSIVTRINLAAVISALYPLVHASIPLSVTLELESAADLPAIEADPAQIQQVMMNLIINAAEAIGDNKGRVSVKVFECQPDSSVRLAPHLPFDVRPGRYVCAAVDDNGCGMSESTQRKIFDPFFSSKFTGRGLGLSAVVGILRGHNGFLKVDSEPGRGSTFRVFLPVAEASSTKIVSGT